MAKLLDRMLARYPTAKRTHLDVACGTGLAMDFFRGRGWQSVGIDASLAMLHLASGPRAAADMRALPFRARFARVTCLYDSLNHMLDRRSLVAAFRAVRAVMEDDALFFFDVNHPEIYPEVWGASDPFVSVGSEHHLEIATTYRARDKRATAMITGWAVVGGKRVEIKEQHRQRAWSERELRSALAEARLAAVDVVNFDPYLEPIQAPTVKLFFVVKPT